FPCPLLAARSFLKLSASAERTALVAIHRRLVALLAAPEVRAGGRLQVALRGVADVAAALQIRGAADSLAGLGLARPSATVTTFAADGRHVGTIAAHRLAAFAAGEIGRAHV